MDQPMHVILNMAISANGLISGEDDDASWVSPIEWASFKSKILKTGNMIIGRRTYDLMLQEGSLEGLDKVSVIVLSRKKAKAGKPNISYAKTPAECLSLLERKGFATALLAGGGKTITSFLKEGLIDELYLDVEPILIGRGIPLLAPAAVQAKLQLIETTMLSKNEIQLHYLVEKDRR